MSTLGEIGERALIRVLSGMLPKDSEGHPFVGDDTAVIPDMEPGFDGLLTTDPLIEGVHFLPETEPRRIGHKAAGRVLSDIAAMGGEPRWLLVNLVAPASTPVVWIEGVYAGLLALAEKVGAKVVGGDVAEGPVRELHLFGVGRVASGQAVRRSGAKVGDVIGVTGRLGGSLAGKHLDFEPRLEAGVRLARAGVSAMMDLSDGLATDLQRLAEASGVGVRLEEARIPIAEACDSVAGALSDGEDYELLFTIPNDRVDVLADWAEVSLVGVCTDEPGVYALERPSGEAVPLLATGFEHFSETGP